MGITAGGVSPRQPLRLSFLLHGVSALAFCTLAAAPAYAQAPKPKPQDTQGTAGQTQGSDEAEAPETRVADSTDVEEQSAEGQEGDIIVTGLRQSLANSQNIKRNADTVVD